VSATVLAAALFTRFRSRQEHAFAEKVLSALRKGFGGHQEPPKPTGTAEGKQHGLGTRAQK
jgi:6-phosphogluconate dehydrogenase